MMYLRILLFFLLFSFTTNADAQQFDKTKFTISKKKTAYIKLIDGPEFECTVDKKRRKRQFIRLLHVELENGDVKELEIENIEYAYLPPTDFGEVDDKIDRATDLDYISERENSLINDSLVMEEGYRLLESHEIKLYGRKKPATYLLQVVNPGFSDVLKVFSDPNSDSEASVGIGPMSAGGFPKSFYIQWQGEEEVSYITKREYLDNFSSFWKDKCQRVVRRYKKNLDWDELPKHAAFASENCAE